MAPGDYFLENDIKGVVNLSLAHSFRSRWGLISRFSDMEAMLAFHPKVIESHLAEQDFEMEFVPQGINGRPQYSDRINRIDRIKEK